MKRAIVALAVCVVGLSARVEGQGTHEDPPGWCTWSPGPPDQPPMPECPNGSCERKCPSCQNSPNFVSQGQYATSVTDLTVASSGFPITVTRTYASWRGLDGPLGKGWVATFSPRITRATYLFSAPSTYTVEAAVTMASGFRFTFTENADGSYTPPSGRADALVREGNGTYTLVPEGRRETLHFGVDGSLLSHTNDHGQAHVYSYDGAGKLERITESSSGEYLDVYWGADGRVSNLQASTGIQVAYFYNASTGTLETVRDTAGRDTHYTYVSGRFSPLISGVKDHWNRPVTDVTYDAKDRMVSYTEQGETYTYEYEFQDSNPNQRRKRDSSNNLTQYEVDARGQITSKTEPDGSQIVRQFDADGRVTNENYPYYWSVAYVYRPDGRLKTSTTWPLRREYYYDSVFTDKVAEVRAVHAGSTYGSAPNPAWQTTRYDYYPQGHPNAGQLFHTYRLRNDGTTLDTLATYEYDAQNRVTRQTDGSGAATDTVYDGQGRVTTVTGPANNLAGTRPVTTYAYDTNGRVQSVTDPEGKETSYTYDALGRVKTVTLPKPTPGSPLTFTTTYTYDVWDGALGLVFTEISDPNGRVTRLGYDQFGRLLRSIDAAGNATTYGYTRKNLTSITDANGNVTGYEYDVNQRLKKTVFPDGGQETYTYHPDSQLATKTDRRGTTETYTYDFMKRLITKALSTGGSVAYNYDGDRLLTIVDSTVSPTETHTFTYDAAYRMATVAEGTRGTVSYTYGAGDRLATMTPGSGPSVTYAYYPDGSLRTLTWGAVSGDFTYTYRLSGAYDTISFPNGQQRTYGYDDQGRLLTLTNAIGTTTLAATSYAYDEAHPGATGTFLGQRTSQTLTLPSLLSGPAQTKYLYDPLYQLKEVRYPSGTPYNGETHAWTYDAIGNRLTASVNGTSTAYTYFKNGSNPLNGQRLQSDGTNAYGYDAAGNNTTRTGAQSFTLGYDTKNRLASISGAATASYAYDAQGRRGSKTVGGTTTAYLYDGQNLVREATGASTSYYLFGPGIDEPLASYDGTNVRYLDVDGIGSVLATNDTSGTATHSVAFDAWGTERGQSGTRSNPFTYTGREVGEAGLLFYRARFYQTGIGRFAQEDPIGFDSGQPSFYAYVMNSPLQFEDPSGLGPVGWVVQLGKKGLIRVRALCSKKAATAARRKGLNVEVDGTRQAAHELEAAAAGGQPILKHTPHKPGYRPHYQTPGKPGHTFWSSVGVAIGLVFDSWGAADAAGPEETMIPKPTPPAPPGDPNDPDEECETCPPR